MTDSSKFIHFFSLVSLKPLISYHCSSLLFTFILDLHPVLIFAIHLHINGVLDQ